MRAQKLWKTYAALIIAIQGLEEFRIDKIDVMNGVFGPEVITFDV